MTRCRFQNAAAAAAHLPGLPRAVEQEATPANAGATSGRRKLCVGVARGQSGCRVSPPVLGSGQQVGIGRVAAVLGQVGGELVARVKNLTFKRANLALTNLESNLKSLVLLETC